MPSERATAREFTATLRSLRATRSFRPDAVPDAALTELLETARWTGSARNRQPWRVVPVDDAGARNRLATLGRYAAHLSSAPLVLLLAVDHELGGADAEFDAGRFAQTLMLAAHAHGLGSCPVSFFPDANVRVATELAGLAEPWRVRTAIAIGYPAAAPPMPGARPAIPTGRRSVAAITGGTAQRVDQDDPDGGLSTN